MALKSKKRAYTKKRGNVIHYHDRKYTACKLPVGLYYTAFNEKSTSCLNCLNKLDRRRVV